MKKINLLFKITKTKNTLHKNKNKSRQIYQIQNKLISRNQSYRLIALLVITKMHKSKTKQGMIKSIQANNKKKNFKSMKTWVLV